MKAWFSPGELRNLVGIITDYYIDYIELKEIRTGEYFLIHESKVEIII